MEKKLKYGHKWLPTPSSFKIQTPPKILSEYVTVKELLTTNRGWNTNLILEIFFVEQGETIQNIPLEKTMQENKLILVLTQNVKFTIKSAYFFALQSKLDCKGSPSQISNSKWKRIWSLSVLENVKNFLWRAHNNSLSTKTSLHYRKISLDLVCLICKQEAEIVTHLVWNCSAANDVWETSMLLTHKCQGLWKILINYGIN